MRKSLHTAAIVATTLFFTSCSSDNHKLANISGPDTIYRNGNIYTLNTSNTVASAIAIDNGIIVSVGSDANITKLAGRDTTIIDLAGKTMIPGIYDAHSHFSGTGVIALFQQNLNSPPIGSVDSIEDIISIMSKKVATSPEGTWLQGFGYDDTLLAENRHPTREDLDRISTSHPIIVVHISGHLAAANSIALTMAGIDKDTPQPEGGVIRKDASGKPTGILEEYPAMTKISSLIPAATDDQTRQAIAYAATSYAAVGVTTANEGVAVPKQVKLINEVAASEVGLPIRVVAWPILELVDMVEQLPLTTDQITIGGVKEFSDGSIQGYNGYLSKPYHVIPEGFPDDYRGFPRRDREALAARILQIHKAGRQALVHGNGDAAIDDILYAFRQAQSAYPREDTRHVIIHSQMAREDQLDEMKKLGVIPSFFVLHTYYWGDRHRDIFMGPKRAANMSPTRSAGIKNIPYTIHTDTPVVPMEPMRLIWSAVNRVSTSGSVIGSEQTVSAVDALRATTINAAYQNFEETSKGSIEVGKLADLVILSDDILTIDTMLIKDIVVLATIVGGNVVYEKDNKI